MEKARIFNIERCSTEDGPGIRTTVFLKGCSLHCLWCANPESQSRKKEILFKHVICIGCGRCEKNCPENAIYFDAKYGFISDMNKCSLCMTCIDHCYAGARVIQGEDYSVEELMTVLERDDMYYRRSGGGITFSGGEPLLQADFICACAEKIHKAGWNVLIETCGQAPIENLKKVAAVSDIIYCDYKQSSPVKHRELTGQDNTTILNNITWMDENFGGELYLRYPYIPGYNDQKESIETFLSYAEGLKKVNEVVFLPFHRLGLEKYRGLGRDYAMGNMPSLKVKDLAFLKEYQKQFNLRITIM